MADERNGYRTQSFLDTLTSDEANEASRVLAMPGGSMAVAYVAVMVMRMKHEATPSRPKQAGVGVAGGTVGAALALIAQQVLTALNIGL